MNGRTGMALSLSTLFLYDLFSFFRLLSRKHDILAVARALSTTYRTSIHNAADLWEVCSAVLHVAAVCARAMTERGCSLDNSLKAEEVWKNTSLA
jgi:hypothetical protein